MATLTKQEQLGLEEVFGVIQKRNRLRYELTYIKNRTISKRKASIRYIKTNVKRARGKLKNRICRLSSIARFC